MQDTRAKKQPLKFDQGTLSYLTGTSLVSLIASFFTG